MSFLIPVNLICIFYIVVPRYNFVPLNWYGHPNNEPSFLKLLFDCPMDNFGPWSRGQPHSPDVNHCVAWISTQRSLVSS